LIFVKGRKGQWSGKVLLKMHLFHASLNTHVLEQSYMNATTVSQHVVRTSTMFSSTKLV